MPKIRDTFKAMTDMETEEEEQYGMSPHVYPVKKKKKRKKTIKAGSYFRKRMTDYDKLLEEAYQD